MLSHLDSNQNRSEPFEQNPTPRERMFDPSPTSFKYYDVLCWFHGVYIPSNYSPLCNVWFHKELSKNSPQNDYRWSISKSERRFVRWSKCQNPKKTYDFSGCIVLAYATQISKGFFFIGPQFDQVAAANLWKPRVNCSEWHHEMQQWRAWSVKQPKTPSSQCLVSYQVCSVKMLSWHFARELELTHNIPTTRHFESICLELQTPTRTTNQLNREWHNGQFQNPNNNRRRSPI